MAAFNYWGNDTSGTTNGVHPFNSPFYASTAVYYQRIVQTVEKALTGFEKLAQAVARARERPRVPSGWTHAVSAPPLIGVTPEPLLVRRMMQRAGPSGFRRLGGRRPL